jgi:predicted CopG family antitoxin
VSFIKRTRIISTRVSEEEYEELQRISREHGASSVSDYVRRMVVNSIPALLDSENGGHAVAAEVAALHRKVEWLAQILEQGEREAVPRGIGQQNEMPNPDDAVSPQFAKGKEVPAGFTGKT